MSTVTLPEASIQKLDRELSMLADRVYDVQALVRIVREALDAMEDGKSDPIHSAFRTLTVAEDLASDIAEALGALNVRTLDAKEAA